MTLTSCDFDCTFDLFAIAVCQLSIKRILYHPTHFHEIEFYPIAPPSDRKREGLSAISEWAIYVLVRSEWLVTGFR